MRFDRIHIGSKNKIQQTNRFCFLFQDKEYIIGKKRENIDNKQFESVGKHVKQLEENVIRLEKQLAAKYRTDFAELFQQIPTIDQNDSKAVLNWVETWKQYRNIAALNQTMIGDLETKLDVVKKKEHEYNDRAAQKNALLEDLKREGEWIVADLDSLALKFFGPSALSANMALASSLRETIDCIKIQVRNRLKLYVILYQFHKNVCFYFSI